MKQLGRWLSNGFFALLLLACAGGWVFSDFRSAQVAYWGNRENVFVVINRGHILCEVNRGRFFDLQLPLEFPRWYWDVERPDGFGHLHNWANSPSAWYYTLGFAGKWGRPNQYGSVKLKSYLLSIPLWLPLLFCFVPAMKFYRQYRQVRLKRERLCARCGYDLRATPDRCPECGTVPAKKELTSG